MLIAVAAIGLGGIVVLGFVSEASAKHYTCESQVPVPAGDVPASGIERPDAGNRHVTVGSDVKYAECPPTSGSHYSARASGPIPPAIYGPGDRAEPTGWIHNLEHGFIVALYRGEPSAADLDALRAFFERAPATESAQRCGYRAKVLVARFDEMSTPFAVLAWHHLLQLPAWDGDKALDFARQWIETAPESGAC